MENATTKTSRHADIYAAIEALNLEIHHQLEAVRALELVYFGRVVTGELEFIPKEAPEPEKVPPQPLQRRRKAIRKGKGRRKLSQTPAAKTARAWRAKQKEKEAKAAAGQSTAEKAPAAAPKLGGGMLDTPVSERKQSAHEALKTKTEAELDAEQHGPIEQRPSRTRQEAREAAPQLENPEKNSSRKSSLPPVRKGSLTGITQVEAIRTILRKAARPLNSSEILDRMLVGGYRFISSNPKQSLSATLSNIKGDFQTETRAGRVLWHPITEGGSE